MKLAVLYNPGLPELRRGLLPDVFQSGEFFSSGGIRAEIVTSAEVLCQYAPDVVHAIGVDASGSGWIRRPGNPRPRIVLSPLISTSRSPMFSRILGLLPSTRESGLRAVAPHVDAIVAQHEMEQALVSAIVSSDRCPADVIPLTGVTEFCTADPAPFSTEFPQRDFILASVDAASPTSNVFRLVQALEKVNNPSIVLVRGGEGALDEPTRMVARSNSHLIILDADRIGMPMCISALAACSVFVDAGEVVLQSVAALAAAAAGARIVVSRHGAMNGFFGGEAEYVEPSSWELIHHGIITALNRKRDGRLSEQIGKIGSGDRIVERLLGLYERLLSGQR